MSKRESMGNVIAVAVVLCLVCSLMVSASAVGLRERQEENRQLDRQKNILDATGLAQSEMGQPAAGLKRDDVERLFQRVEMRFVDLKTGEFVEMDTEKYDERKAVKSEKDSFSIADATYKTGIPVREKVARVYLVFDKRGQKMEQIVLPIYGKGLWSTLYGYLAVDDDVQTVRGLTFYEHAETPGLGGEIDNPQWKEQWKGLKLYDTTGRPAAGVSKGPAPAGSPHLVDGLSGATITSNGVTALVRSWLSVDGYGPLLKRLAENPPTRNTGEATNG